MDSVLRRIRLVRGERLGEDVGGGRRGREIKVVEFGGIYDLVSLLFVLRQVHTCSICSSPLPGG